MSQQDNKDMAKYFYRASAADFKKIPGSPVAYWATANMLKAFTGNQPLHCIATPRAGMITGNNAKFVRLFHEVNCSKISFDSISRSTAKNSGKRWFPYQKGGPFRKYYGNMEYVVDWEDDGHRLRYTIDAKGKVPAHAFNEEYIFRANVNWSAVTSGSFSSRITVSGSLFDASGSAAFPDDPELVYIISSFLNSPIARMMISFINPTLNFQAWEIGSLPLLKASLQVLTQIINNTKTLRVYAKTDWDIQESAWDFSRHPCVCLNFCQPSLISTYQKVRAKWLETTLEMQRLEEENNRIFIDAYGLQEELTSDVPLSEITLTCNPHYRYGGNLTDQEREDRLQSDTIAELISYAIGCMMGRYSLDREGLVYAHSSNVGFSELVAEGAYQTFHADGDGILPLTSEHWFDDDVAARVEEFVRTVWGEEHLEENLQFIADSLCLSAIKPVKKSGETARETIRRYLSTQFFKDHLKTYKKRPIYWLFSSGKEKAFECLVYLHRYNEATLPRMRTEYVSPLLGQMAGRIERLRLQKIDAATAEAKRLDKEIDSLTKQLTELRAFDDQLKHYADMKITLDLDDGVKVNYGKFGNLLAEVKAITGDKGE